MAQRTRSARENRVLFVFLLGVCLGAVRLAAGDVLPESLPDGPRAQMMQRYLFRDVDAAWTRWQEEYEKRTDAEAIATYQRDRIAYLRQAIGEFPERTPLNARVTATHSRPGYRVENVLFESQPEHLVTGNTYVPDSPEWAPPYPAVLVPCGHYENGKAWEEYQSMGALLALNGMVALVFDPIEQGERVQLEPETWGTRGHMMIAIGSILLGRNTATFEIWDGIRALDYLVSREDVDAARIGCTGNSGGGTQTSYLTVLDDRIRAAAPSCYHHVKHVHVRGPFGDAENAIFGQLRVSMEPADYLMLRAPEVKILVCAATNDFLAIDATWTLYRYAQRLYTRLGYSERLSILENDAPHNYGIIQREGVVRWMARWLQGRDEVIEEPVLELFTDQELLATDSGRVVDVPGYRSTYDLNAEYAARLAPTRRKVWDDPISGLAAVRALTGIRALSAIPIPKVQRVETQGGTGLRVEQVVLEPEPGILLPGRLFSPTEKTSEAPVLLLNDEGHAHADIARVQHWTAKGSLVLALDVRGLGETQATVENNPFPFLGPDYRDIYIAYLLGRSYVAMRSEDILVAARFLAAEAGSPRVRLEAMGSIGVPALHAAALETDLFESVMLARCLESWEEIVTAAHTQDQLANVVHGALGVYDLPDLANVLGDRLRRTGN